MAGSFLATVTHPLAAAISADVITVFLFWVGAFCLSILFGRGRMISWVIALIAAGNLYMAARNVSWLKGVMASDMYVRLALFLVFAWIVASVLGRVVHGEYSHQYLRKGIQLAVLSAAFAGIFISYAFNFFDLAKLHTPSLLLTTLFTSQDAFFVWLAAGFLAVFIAARR